MDINELYLENIINYKQIINNSTISIKKRNNLKDVTIIIPIKGRTEQILPVVSHLNESIKYYGKKKFRILFVEQDVSPKNKELVLSTSSDYVFINDDGKFNKCLCINVGVLLVKSKYFIFHDVDIIVKKNFIKNIFLNLENINNDKVIHCMNERRVINIDNENSEKIRNKILDINEIGDDIENFNGFEYSDYGATGGSIFVESDLFYSVGGYDDSFFTEYSTEDHFFWLKIETFEKINGCENPKTNVFHLYHQPAHHLFSHEQNRITNFFLVFDTEKKMEYINLKSKNFKY